MKYTGNAASDPGATYPKDTYFLECTHIQDKDENGNDLKSKTSGNDMWILELTVKEGQYAGRKLWHYLVWLKAGAPAHGMTLNALKAFGINPEGENDILPQHLLNVVVKADVDIDAKNEDFPPKNVIRKWHKPDTLTKIGEEDPNGTAQEPDSFDPAKLEKQAAPPPPAKPAAQPQKKPLWGGKPK